MRYLVLCLLCSVLYGQIQTAYCTTHAEKKEQLKKIRKEGSEAYSSGDFEEAVVIFERYLTLDKHPVIYEYLGNCYRHLKQYNKAANAYKKYIKRYPDAPTIGKVRRYLKDVEEELEASIPRLEIISNPPGVQIYLDQNPLGITPIEVPITTGMHILRGELKAHLSVHSQFIAEQGEQLVFNWTMNPVETETPQLKLTANELAARLSEQATPGWPIRVPKQIFVPRKGLSDRFSPSYESMEDDSNFNFPTATGWVLVGAGTISLVMGIIFQVKSSRADSDAQDCWEKRENYLCLDSKHTEYKNDANYFQDSATYLFIGAGVGLATGLTLLIVDWAVSSEPEREGVSFAPVIGNGEFGVGVQGFF